ncbi:hypothetical protein MKZ42_12645 [Pseudoalteromonas shioyasakiensis]|uniref:Uncharacterized protein n=1 Tax=Pseudoalteromonas shioyasakiensis TaxID=1190813 RepID=A0ABT6U673_9GAMM|nr:MULTISPECIES: hypothetical protein [Pseudoalteromonas]MDI4671530.1 hypothetical protein [Pseudoalteromonas shioyasakiensis]MDI4674113.1 hypothetical protein [Pseudoalteromonas shioyasakiensis]MDI4688461.1 hypothetical protein [Pseudoalteromonas shioyasakiensis]MDI4707035.1 hypothetical protein [Pseudoalteromonas shioyasakiensis]NUJ23691.1 hypothetical protein [Pseudoalteromonas sp. 0802]
MILLENELGDEFLNSIEYQEALRKALEEAGTEIVKTVPSTHHEISARPIGYWNNTGVYKPKGITLLVVYTGGKWRSNPHWGPTDAAGDSRYPAPSSYLKPGAPEGCLIGKVGGSNISGGSPVFAIGNHGYVPPEYEGLLWLTVNDEERGFGDNHGQISVAIRHIRA